MASQPPLRRVFDTVEQAVAKPLESIAETRTFVDVIAVRMRLERAARGLFERQTRKALHFWNMPAQTDIKRLTRQVSALGNEVRSLTAQLQDAKEAAEKPAPRKRTKSGP